MAHFPVVTTRLPPLTGSVYRIMNHHRFPASQRSTSSWLAGIDDYERWLNAQKKLANVSEDKLVYIPLRLDGRVRGSGVGYPPWERFSVQLPPLTGIWKGPLDGMDGRI